jgi:signal transduction histidine kinase
VPPAIRLAVTDRCRIMIADNGGGISPETIARILDYARLGG